MPGGTTPLGGYPWHSSDTIGGRPVCDLPGAFEPVAAPLSYAAV